MARGSPNTPVATLRARIDRYRATDPTDPASPPTVQLGRRLLAGEELASADARALGCSSSLLGVLVRDFERAGYWVRTRRVPGTNGVVYYLDGGADATPRDDAPPTTLRRRKAAPRPRRAERLPATTDAPSTNGHPPPEVVGRHGAEVAGHYPRLGAVMLVRALALDDDGGVILHLRDPAEGAVWQVAVTGYVRAPS